MSMPSRYLDVMTCRANASAGSSNLFLISPIQLSDMSHIDVQLDDSSSTDNDYFQSPCNIGNNNIHSHNNNSSNSDSNNYRNHSNISQKYNRSNHTEIQNTNQISNLNHMHDNISNNYQNIISNNLSNNNSNEKNRIKTINRAVIPNYGFEDQNDYIKDQRKISLERIASMKSPNKPKPVLVYTKKKNSECADLYIQIRRNEAKLKSLHK